MRRQVAQHKSYSYQHSCVILVKLHRVKEGACMVGFYELISAAKVNRYFREQP